MADTGRSFINGNNLFHSDFFNSLFIGLDMADKAMIVDRLLSGKIKLHEVDKYVDDVDEAVAIRLTFAETISGTSLSHLSRYSLDMKRLHNRNIENPSVQYRYRWALSGL